MASNNPAEGAELIAHLVAELKEASAQHASLHDQIDSLAHFIMRNVPGEPSQNEGAVDCAIRIIRTLQTKRTDPRCVDPAVCPFCPWCGKANHAGVACAVGGCPIGGDQ